MAHIWFGISGSPVAYFYVKRLAREVQKIDRLYHRIVTSPYTYIDAPELLTSRELYEGMEELSNELDQCAVSTIADVIFATKDAKKIRKRYEKMAKIVEGSAVVSAFPSADNSIQTDRLEQEARVMRTTMRQIIADHLNHKDSRDIDDYVAIDGAMARHRDMYTHVYQYISERIIHSFRDDLVLPSPEGLSPEELFREVHKVIAPQGSLPYIRFLGACDRFDIRPMSL